MTGHIQFADFLARPRVSLAWLPSHARPNLFGCD
jgi:hypothetical protein